MIKERLGRAINQLFTWAKSWDPQYVGGMTRDWSGSVAPRDNPQANVDSIRYTIWAYICIKKISESIAGLPLKFYEGKGDDQKEIFDGPIVNILKRPNKYTTHRDLWIDTVVYLLSVGKAAWRLSEFTRIGQPVEGISSIWTIPAHRIQVIRDAKTYIGGYKIFQEDGSTYTLPPEQVAYFKTFNPTDPFNGLSPMTVAEQIVESDFYARDHNKVFLKSGCALGTVLQTDSRMLPEDTERLKAAWRKNHSGYKNWDDVDVLHNGLKIADAKNSPKDIEFLDMIKLNREEIISLFGVPPAVVGLFEYANYANAMMQKREYWDETLIPIIEHIDITCNELIIPRWSDRPITMKHDLSEVKALRDDETTRATTAVGLKQARIITANEARARVGYDPINDPAADQLDAAPTGFTFQPPSKSFNIKSYDKRTDVWLKKDAFRRRHEANFIPVINEYFDAQKERILKKLKGFDDGFPPRSMQLIFDETDEIDKLKNDIEVPIIKTFTDAAQAGYEEVQAQKNFRQGIETKDDLIAGFDVSDPAVVDFLKRHALDAAQLITITTRDRLAELLAQAYDEGLPIRDIAKTITDWFDGFPSGRSYAIAQTEMGNAVNTGTFEGYKQAGADKKRWLATPDERTRDSHHAAGQTPAIPMEQAFVVGDSLMMYPNDPAGSAGEIINCRCTLAPVVEV